jgi:hypothetical protein
MSTRFYYPFTLFSILILVLALSSTGCDRLMQITGTVYEWVNPPEKASSLVFHKEISPTGLLKEDIPTGLTLTPLKDVHISASGKYKADTFYSNEVTDEAGKYKLIISLGYKTDSYDATIEANHPGYMGVRRLIKDVGESHIVTIILVRSPSDSE